MVCCLFFVYFIIIIIILLGDAVFILLQDLCMTFLLLGILHED
jgi:hypothetical protein